MYVIIFKIEFFRIVLYFVKLFEALLYIFYGIFNVLKNQKIFRLNFAAVSL